MKKISLIIPSRTQAKQLEFINRAISSIGNQSIIRECDIEIFICLDKNCLLDDISTDLIKLKIIQSDGKSQAAALNAGIRAVSSDYVGFLEDDDQWHPDFLETTFKALEHCKFVSSTQLELNEKNEVIRINDFPTPSGWFMPMATLRRVGEFSEEYRFHLDNDWLGRLSESEISRGHLIESTAPKDSEYLAIRPWLSHVITQGGINSRLFRHSSPYPLVTRLVHSGSGMAQISKNPILSNISIIEQQKLQSRYGRIPW